MGLYDGKVVLVTASASGIGKEISRAFAKENASIIVTDFNTEAGKETEKEFIDAGYKVQFIFANMLEENSVKELFKQVHNAFGRLDVLVNNAGGVVEGTVLTHTIEEWKRQYDLNVTSGFLASREAIPMMAENGGGAILNISSEVGLKGYKGRAAYTASKTAIIGMTRAMAVDHADLKIRVNALCPGTVETPGIKALIEQHGESKRQEFISRRLTGYLGTPEDIANFAVFVCSDLATYINGSILTIDGGSTVK